MSRRFKLVVLMLTLVVGLATGGQEAQARHWRSGGIGMFNSNYFHHYHNYGGWYTHRPVGAYYTGVDPIDGGYGWGGYGYGGYNWRGSSYRPYYGGWSDYRPYAYTPMYHQVGYYAGATAPYTYSTNAPCTSCGTAVATSTTACSTCVPTCGTSVVAYGPSCTSCGWYGKHRRGLFGSCPLKNRHWGCASYGVVGFSDCCGL